MDESEKSNAESQYENHPCVELDPFLAIETEHGPIFRRELFDAAYAAYQSLDHLDHLNRQKRDTLEIEHTDRFLRQKITLRDCTGKKHEKPVLAAGYRTQFDGQPHVTRRCWIYNSLQRLGGMYNECLPEDLLPYTFGVQYTKTEESNCFEEDEIQHTSGTWVNEWERSDLCDRLAIILKQNIGSTAAHVNKIVCFGLGCFPAPWKHNAKRSYISASRCVYSSRHYRIAAGRHGTTSLRSRSCILCCWQSSHRNTFRL